jgi:membrane dipeptidase
MVPRREHAMVATITTPDTAQALHHEALVINALDSSNEDKFTTEYVDALRAGGIDVVNVTVPWPEDTFRQAVTSYMHWYQRLNQAGPAVRIVRTVSDIKRAQADGVIGVILGFQNAKPIEDDLTLVDIFHLLGIRIIQLTYNRRNLIGNGVAERRDEGLSHFGVDVVKTLNARRIVVDLAHVGTRTALDAAEISTAPVIVSHAASRSRCAHFRCIPDELARAVAATGGCVGVAALSILLRDDAVTDGATLEDYLDHLSHFIEVAGIDHVGIGFDVGFKRTDQDTAKLEAAYPEFKFPPLALRYVAELNRADKAPNLTAGLLARGFSDDDVRKILGLNWLRVFGDVWGE